MYVCCMDIIDSITSIQHIVITLAFPAGPFSFSSLSSVSPLLLRSSALTLRSRWDTCQKATQPHAANSWARHTQFTAGGKDMLLCENKAPCVSHSVLSDIKIYKGLVLLQNTKVLKEQWWGLTLFTLLIRLLRAILHLASILVDFATFCNLI